MASDTLPSPPDGGKGLLHLLVRQIRFEAAGINSYELVDPAGAALPAFDAGAHIDVYMEGGLVRQYSLSNAPHERHRYVIAVLRDEAGRGGSKALHGGLHVQDVVPVSPPRNHFALDAHAKKVILLAGGIGITPLKAMAHRLEEQGGDYELHYCAKDRAHAAFGGEFAEQERRGRLHFHFDGGVPSAGLDIARLLSDPAPGTHLYYCGPGGFMKACAGAAAHWPAGTVHSEHFKAPEPAVSFNPTNEETDALHAIDGFSVEIASTGQAIAVGPYQSIADALEEAGVAIETSCRAGLCGTCKVRYLSGTVEHQDCILSDEEKTQFLTTCVSRATSKVLVLDL
ncbi:PDR/VanB family oxidoreductase [Robbsia sp. Bb-Pol-6]|uniref:PDR/VanB family oxidoreductase n=1 Tax=Robbsia betulipollinis TaxID=2981849 RepID=A0ABT3ZKD7_9BURK|nr:PDR/VanB family oxidoreductase [Robbsia betulipollinis]MCY0386994.1 PDR/VanB family oxidoreductase [Robbsia betulipollinis]